MLEGKNTLHFPFGNGGSPIKMSHFKFKLNEALQNYYGEQSSIGKRMNVMT